MQYAIVNGEKVQASRGLRGTCNVCGAETVAKCGPRIRHHWAHAWRQSCDPWWENETDWHRQWKNLFPEECREVVDKAHDGEIHRADIKTPSGIFIEVQHSSMSDAERQSREEFYQNLVWIVDGRPFLQNFEVCHALPDPFSELAADLKWSPAGLGLYGANAGIFTRRSDPESYYGFFHQIEHQIYQQYRGHHQYVWKRARSTWLDARCPVFIDFGHRHLIKLGKYGDTDLPCIRYVSKDSFVSDAVNSDQACSIGTTNW